MRIALTGNPNSGKTTMYNALTGRKEKIGNWAGVTVDMKEAEIKKEYCNGVENLVAVDLPGAYSMSPYTSEESVTSTYVKNENPDVIVNIVDATNLSRSLFFTTQLLELGIPMVVALNKADINKKKETLIDKDKLSKELGCPVVDTISTESEGLANVISKAVEVVGKEQKILYRQKDVSTKEEYIEEDKKRFDYVATIIDKVETRKTKTSDLNFGDRIDEIITHPIIGIAVFAVVMWLVFFISQSTLGTMLSDLLAGWIEDFGALVGDKLDGANPFLVSIIVDGIIGGVGAVVGFLPLVMIMYFLIALLEDSGYMARATVVLDPIFKKVGLSGKSAIPMIIGTGCAVPATMACRTIKDERERKSTAMITSFMPCGAKIPVIALFAGAFFPGSKWVAPTMYFVGILSILAGALIIKAITKASYKKSFFIIELPDYKVPSLKFAFDSMLERGKAYIIKAATIILVCNTVVQVIGSFNWQLVECAADESILASVANPFGYLLLPIVGFASWKFAAAAITGFIAKENVCATIATVFALESTIIDNELVGSGNEVMSALAIGKVAALAFLMFNLYTPPCFAALGAMRSEVNDRKWFWGGVGLQFGFGFTIAILVYQVGTLLTTGHFGNGLGLGLSIVAIVVITITYLICKSNSKVKNG